MRDRVTRLVEHRLFERTILAVILLNSVVLGLETSPEMMDRHGAVLETLDRVFISIYVAEMILKLVASRLAYFRSGWNVFDFLIVVSSLLPAGGTFTGLRVLRVLRVLRLVSGLKPLRKIVSSILRSAPGIGWTVLLMMIIYYIFAIVGIHLFRPQSPERFGSLGAAFTSLFQLTTLDNWGDIVFPLTSANGWAWVYFVLFITMASFVLINVILGIVVDSLNLQSKDEEKESIEAAKDPDATASDMLRSEVLQLKAQVDRIACLVEQTVEPEAQRRR
ncbi:MAG: ion transporter [Micrococcales bacterium]|nr:ion transporter [Micrococcales bacterium]